MSPHNEYWFLGSWTRPKSRNHENDGFSDSPIMKSESYYSKMKQNNSTELVGYSFNHTYHKNDPKILKKRLNMFPMNFLWLSYDLQSIFYWFTNKWQESWPIGRGYRWSEACWYPQWGHQLLCYYHFLWYYYRTIIINYYCI